SDRRDAVSMNIDHAKQSPRCALPEPNSFIGASRGDQSSVGTKCNRAHVVRMSALNHKLRFLGWSHRRQERVWVRFARVWFRASSLRERGQAKEYDNCRDHKGIWAQRPGGAKAMIDCAAQILLSRLFQ